MLVQIAVSSLLARKFTMTLTVISIAVSFFVLLGIDHIKSEMRHSFGRTVSGVDIIVGARSSSINLLLYSVFRVGNATNNISWSSYKTITDKPNVAWSIPISLGDSHQGFRVLGTTNAYFEHYRYGNKQVLSFSEGHAFSRLYDVVIGADVARQLGYQLHSPLDISHGVGKVSFKKHTGFGFEVTGILKPTGTPIDQTVHITLPAVDSIHGSIPHGSMHSTHSGEVTHNHSMPDEDSHEGHEESHSDNNPLLSQISAQPKAITAFMLGLTSKIATLGALRQINEFENEPLLAIMPGVALSEMWQIMKVVEQALAVIAFLVLIAALFGLVTMLLATMNERQREIAVLRAAGASASFIVILIESEALLLVLTGMLCGFLGLVVTMFVGQDMLASQFGIFISSVPSLTNLFFYVGLVLVLTFILALVPALISYRRSMIHGLSVNY
ncbi:ABC transporter permease [Alteromonas sp. a30]|uniref:ABC transporter permease n=1 Tax=Alteromonas sp. a30 TaxID=2730917 RepID=UPI00227E6877|nr:FtsX-like permease family protein [Alteromonas sp. a30]MCY7296436.1 ABC transporter permease [Alteromonas sp. a30]